MGSRWIWWREIALRLGFFALVVSVVQIEVLASQVAPDTAFYVLNASAVTGLVGFVLAAMGVGLAIGARATLGVGWATPASSRRELVTNGPYAFVRHPMYGGLLIAMLGSAVGQSVLWVLPLMVYGPGFISSARREESLLMEQFADGYREYRGRTRMFVPFVI
jgi:protein-S-isoprenylcysteine O-methyltransferase Ste14